MTLVDILTLSIAAYGAVVASILGLREIQRENRRLKIILEYMAFFEFSQITIINVGHRPVTISGLSAENTVGHTETGKPVLETVPQNALFADASEGAFFPVTLADGEHISIPLAGSSGLVPPLAKDSAKIIIYDVEGNVYDEFSQRVYDAKFGGYHPARRDH
jgi:hypothetical protein